MECAKSKSPPPPAAAVEHAKSEDQVDYHLFGAPVERPLTLIEVVADPAIIVVLADESTLGQVLALRTNPIPTLARGGGGPLPNTAAVRLWFRSLVQRYCRAGSSAAMIVEPEVTQNPALPENILLFHQLMGDEVQAIQSFLGVQTAWAAEMGSLAVISLP